MADASLVVRGAILTMSPARPVARAMAISGGRVLAVGTETQAQRWSGRRTRVWALRDDQVIVPGFIDAHAHLASDAWRRTWVDLSSSTSLENALEILSARLKKTRDEEWIVGRGWDESTWATRRYINRHDLDRVSKTRPILVNRVDGHLCAVNSEAFRRVEFGDDLGVERGADGAPTGVLTEDAAERAREVIPRPDDATWADLLADVISAAHALGITSVHDIVDAPHIRVYQELRRQGRLTMRAYLMPYAELLDAYEGAGIRTGFGDELLRVGAVKVFADGSLGARTAALTNPYEDAAHEKGRLTYAPKELGSLVSRAHRMGFQVAVHAIGDRAIDVVVESFARALERDPREDPRHRIEHAELPREETLEQIEDLGIVLSMQPNFVARWSRTGGLYEHRLGERRLTTNNPYRQILALRIPLAFGSDGMPYGPLYGIAGATDAPYASQRISSMEAIRAYTAGGAYAGFSESETGTLTVGNLADFAVLPGDPRNARPSPLPVDATVVAGEVVYRRAALRGEP